MYFNHSDLVVDASAYDAIAHSQFLKEEFVHVTETTVRRSADETVTGLVIQGGRTYLSIFKTGSMVLPKSCRLFRVPLRIVMLIIRPHPIY